MSGTGAARRLRPLLGTLVEIGTVAPAAAAIDAAFAAMQAVQRNLSFQDPHSELSRLNASSGEWLEASRHTRRVLRLARAMMIASEGLFDCTIGAQLVRRGVLPSHCSARRAPAGHAHAIEIGNGRVRLREPVLLTVDGIAKGYAVDIGIHALKCAGARAGWINAGGDIRAFGAVTLPVSRREAGGSVRFLGGLRDAAIATSAVAPRRSARFPGTIVAAGRARPCLGVWTVIASRAWRADALTKVAALTAADRRSAVLRRLGGRLVHGPAAP